MPFSNRAQLSFPAVQDALERLGRWGVKVLVGDDVYHPHEPGTGNDFVHLFPWHLALAASRGRSDEHFLHPSVAIAVEAPRGNRFTTTYRAAGLDFIFRTHMGYHRQPVIAPELTSRAKAMGIIDGRHDQSRANRPQLRNASQQLHGAMGIPRPGRQH
jgi:hypothetical protein